MRSQADVVVIGGGTMGSMITWRLSARGHKVVCLEAVGVAHSLSAVAGDSRLFRRTYRGMTELNGVLSLAEEQWRILNTESGEDVFVDCGGLYIGPAGGKYLSELVQCSTRNQLDYQTLSASDVRDQYPQHKIGDHESALFEPGAGFLRTERAVHAAFRLARTQGATVHSVSEVFSTQESSGKVLIRHSQGTIAADSVVIAAGTGSPSLLPEELSKELEARRLILTWFPVMDPPAFHHSRFPIFVHLDEEVSVYGAPALDGSSLKSSLELDLRPTMTDHPDKQPVLTSQEKAESEATAERFFNGVYPAVSREECLTDLYTTDQQAIVGLVPGRSRTYVATGFSGAGFKMSAGVGESLARSITENEELPDFWDPARFA